MVLGFKDQIPEEDETKSEGKKEESEEDDAKPKYTRKELKDKIWKIVGEGHSDALKTLLAEVTDFDNLEEILNEENSEVNEDGDNLLSYCIKEGCDRGPSWGHHFHKCAEILIEHNVDVNHHNKAGQTPLYEAVFHKDTSYITLLLHHGAESDRFDQDGVDPLHLAIHLGYKECFRLLVENQPKEILDRKDGKGNPPLVAAVQHGHIELCRLLLEGGCDINADDKKFERSALHYAVIAKRFDIFELLLKHHPDLEHTDHKGRTIFHRVCAINEAKYLKKLLHCGIKIMPELVEQETDDGLTPVIVACQNGNAEELKELLENGAAVKATDKTGKNALHFCADNLETQCAEMLLMRDESLLHMQDEQGFTPLHMAVIGGNVPLLKLLVRKGADVNILDGEGHTPAHWATGNHLEGVRQVCTHLEILDVLIEHDAELSKCDSHNAYPIHYAAQMNGRDNGHSDSKIGEKVLKKLLDSGIPCDVLDKDRRQPLLWAASAGNSESCKLLVTAGADVNSVDKDGLTALHCAASRGHTDCVDRLKKLGAEVNIADTNGCTALFYAITLGNKDCTRLLLKYGADPNHKDSRGRTPTHCAAIKGCLETVKILDKHKSDLWHSSYRGDCPIHEAAQGGHCDVVKYLLRWKNSPDAVNVANDAGRTCLHIAAIVNNLPLCKLLLDENADKNPLMKNKSSNKEDSEDKVYTPYDAAIIKGNNEIADYIKSKGGDTGGDIDNLLIAKGIRKSKSAKSRQTLASHPEEEEPVDNKKTEEEEDKKQKSEEEKKKETKKKEKEEAEREKEKFVIVPGEKDKKEKDKKEKDKKEVEKGEKEAKEGKKGADDNELKDLQNKIAAGQGDADERGPNRKPIPVIEPSKEDAKKQKKSAKKDQTDEELEEAKRKIAAGQGDADERGPNRKPIPVVEPSKEDAKKQKKSAKKDQTDEELEEAKRKIAAGQGDADERERRKKEAKEKEAAEKEKSEEKGKKQKGKTEDLSDDELRALQDKIKAGEGGADERDKLKSKTKEEKKSSEKSEKKSAGQDKSGKKSGKEKPELTDKELAATAVAIVAADEAKKQKQKQQKDKEGVDIPKPSESPDLRDQKEIEKLSKDSKEKDKKASKKSGDLDTEEGHKQEIKKKEQQSKEDDELDSKEQRDKSKKVPVAEVATRRTVVTPESRENFRSRRDSPVKDRRSLRSNSTEKEEFEFPEGAPENEDDALKRAEEKRRDRQRSRSRSQSTDRESEDRPEPRKFSKVGNDGRIQPGLLGEKNDRNKRFDDRDSLIDSEDEFIDDPYFGRRIKYGNHRSLVSKRPDNREKVLRDKKRQEMSRTSNRTRTTGGVAKMVPLGYSRLETPQRPITRKSNSVQESVRRYQSERTFVRQLHQLKRAQIYTGPMHDIVLFSKMMNVYKNSTLNDSELDLESQYLDDWDSYLQDNLRFVSHYYEDDRTGLRETAKEYHNHLEKSATDAKKSVENRIDQIIKQNEKQEAAEREENERLNKKINSLAEKTESALDTVRQKADESVISARNLNSSLEEDMRRERHDRLKNSRYTNKTEKRWLLEQEAMDERQLKHDEMDKERKEKHKQWMRQKNEEMRRSLQRVYGPTPVFEPIVSKRSQPKKTSTPKPTMNSSRTSSRPKSMASSISGSRSRPVDQELEVHMTEFGMRRVKTDHEGHTFALSARKSRSHIRPSSVLPANWTPKYDGINLRPRAGLVFVEPAVYDEVLREEQMIRAGVTRNSTRNLTLDTDNQMLETVDS